MKLKGAAKIIRTRVHQLSKTGGADAVAVALYNDGVRGAVCGHETKCALAQDFANRLGKGFSVTVDNGSAVIYSGKKPNDYWSSKEYEEVLLPTRVEAFVSNFDMKRYGFLTQRPNKKGSKK